MKKEIDVNTRKEVNKINIILNYKKVEQMEYVYKNARKLDSLTRKLIKEVV